MKFERRIRKLEELHPKEPPKHYTEEQKELWYLIQPYGSFANFIMHIRNKEEKADDSELSTGDNNETVNQKQLK